MKISLSIKSPGFTIMELVILILVLGIITVSVIPRFISGSEIAANVAADMVASDIRQVQSAAMFGGQGKTIIFDGSGTYTAEGLNLSTRTLPGGATAGPHTINFNSFGEPDDDGVGSFSVICGTTVKLITVSALTGKVPIN